MQLHFQGLSRFLQKYNFVTLCSVLLIASLGTVPKLFATIILFHLLAFFRREKEFFIFLNPCFSDVRILKFYFSKILNAEIFLYFVYCFLVLNAFSSCFIRRTSHRISFFFFKCFSFVHIRFSQI